MTTRQRVELGVSAFLVSSAVRVVRLVARARALVGAREG